jgi:hypothetical protein
MTKQLLKGLWAMSFVAVFAALSVPVEAAEIAAKIPFSFTVNGKTLPEGRYDVSTTGSTLLIRGFSSGAFVLTNGLESSASGSAKLVFHKYGDQYVLRQVWMGGKSGRELPQPRLKGSLAKRGQDGKVATDFEQVVIPVL